MFSRPQAPGRPLSFFLARAFFPLVTFGLLGTNLACQGQTATPDTSGSDTANHSSAGTPRQVAATAKVDTLLKRENNDSAEQSSEQLCNIPQQTKLDGAVQDAGEGHLKFYLKTGGNIPGCSFTVGYIFADHFDIKYLDGGSAGGQPRPTMAMLATIAHAEGTNERYDLTFAFRTFTSFRDHPRMVICAGGYCSSAAGRYQFLDSTWDETRRAVGLRDFSPPSQDRGAVYRMESFRGLREHGRALSRSAFERAIYKINREWASLPGSPYGQPTKPMSTLWSVYQRNL